MSQRELQVRLGKWRGVLHTTLLGEQQGGFAAPNVTTGLSTPHSSSTTTCLEKISERLARRPWQPRSLPRCSRNAGPSYGEISRSSEANAIELSRLHPSDLDRRESRQGTRRHQDGVAMPGPERPSTNLPPVAGLQRLRPASTMTWPTSSSSRPELTVVLATGS